MRNVSVFDTKLIKGPQNWDGTKAKWKHWSLKLEGYLAGVSKTLLDLMTIAARQPTPIGHAGLAEEHVERFVGAFEANEEFAARIREEWTGHAWQFDPYFDPAEIDDSRCTEMVRLGRYDAFKKITTDDYMGR